MKAALPLTVFAMHVFAVGGWWEGTGGEEVGRGGRPAQGVALSDCLTG